MTDEMRNDQSPTDKAPQKTQTRRQLLKGLAGTGIAAGMIAIPNKWTKPVVEEGVLPVHAQGSNPPPYGLLDCEVIPLQDNLVDAESTMSPGFWPNSVLGMTAWITPGDAGIQLKRTVTLIEPGHPQNGELDVWTGPTGVAGTCVNSFDLGCVSPDISPGPDRVVVTWSFVNAADGVGVCSTSIDITLPPQ